MGRRRAGPEAGGDDHSDGNESVNVDSGSGRFKSGSDIRRNLPREGSGTGKLFLILKDMRRVYGTGPDKDVTDAQKRLRKLMGEEPEWFLTKLIDLEKAWMTYKLKIKSSTGEVPHSLKGSRRPAGGKRLDRSEALIDSLLNKAGGVNGAESGDELQAGAEGT